MTENLKLKTYMNKSFPFICAFSIPFLLMLTAYAFLGVYPFGDSTLLSGDMSVQYLAFLSAFRDILTGQASPFYSFGKTLGGEMIGFGAYYIYSPFNLITLLFSRDTLPAAVTLITLLKIGCSGLTMYCCLRSGQARKYSAVFFSVCYALMAYNAAYQLNIMWLDGVILLPLVVYGLEQLYLGTKWYVYSIFLAMALIFNYYTGYMLCLFSVLYFISLLISAQNRALSRFKTCLAFLWASLLAGGLAAAVLLPTALSLQGGKAEFHLSGLLDFKLNFRPAAFLKSFLPLMSQDNPPYIYCGILILLGAVLFFAGKYYPVRVKAAKLFLLLLLFFSMLFYGPDRFWHATAVPAGSPYRYSFLFSFVMIQTAWLWYIRYSPRAAWLRRGSLLSALCLFTGLELTLNSYLALNVGHEIYSEHTAAVGGLEAMMEQLPGTGNSFYRMEVLPKHCLNDPMHFSYNGLTSYSSCEQTATKEFAGKMGINDKGWWINFTGETPITVDSFLGVKYLITDKNTDTDYTRIAESADYCLYENPYALPLGVMADESIYRTYMYDGESIVDVFAIQNQIWKALGAGDDIFQAVPAQETVREDHCVEYEFSPVNNQEIFTNIHNEMLDTMQLWVNGELRREWTPEKQIYPLGGFSPSDTVRVRVESSRNINWYDLFFYYEQKDLLEKEMPDIRRNGYQVKENNGNYLRGSVINDSPEYQYLLLTIPDDDGWRIYVDGTEMEITPALGRLVSVPVAPGAHEVILHFTPPGLKKGLAISAAGGLLLLAFVAAGYRKKTTRRRSDNPPVFSEKP